MTDTTTCDDCGIEHAADGSGCPLCDLGERLSDLRDDIHRIQDHLDDQRRDY